MALTGHWPFGARRPTRLKLPQAARWPGWRQLPREARDTLFLLGVIGWTLLPHLTHLPQWCMALAAVVLLWRARLALANAPLPGRWWLVGVLGVAAALTFWSYGTLLGKEAGVTLAVVLMALKTLELRARRDAFVVFFLGFFLVLTHFLYSQSLLVALAMLVSIGGLLTALVLAHMPVGKPGLRQAGRLAGRTALLGAPVMALLFLLFPRIGPLWGVPQDGVATTGLSNSMRMGALAQLALDDSIAMRLKFAGPVPPPRAMYFRGPVLSRFDGQEWRAQPLPAHAVGARGSLRTEGAPVVYEMTLEPTRLAVLPLLEASTTAPRIDNQDVSGPSALQWFVARPVSERLRFVAEAYPAYRYGPTNRSLALQDDLELPPGYNPRTLAWAEALRADPRYAQADGRTLAAVLLRHIATTGFSYTLAPGEYGRDAVDEFWLDRRSGFCEHFAAAFVVVMRALDVPARIVTGYQGTDREPVDGYWLVRQSAAHAWAEYWQEGVGWVRADPTAAVAPERVDRSARLVAAPGLVAGALGQVNPALLASLRDGWETLNNRWNQWVLNYSSAQQIDVLKRIGFDSPTRDDLTTLLIGALSVLALLGAAWAWWDRHRVDPWTRQMLALRRALDRIGIGSQPHDTPRALAGRIDARFASRGQALTELLQTLERQRYGKTTRSRPDTGLTRRFVGLSRELRATRSLGQPGRSVPG